METAIEDALRRAHKIGRPLTHRESGLMWDEIATLRARVAELEAERRHANMLLEQRAEDLATARTEAAEAMRERAAKVCRAEGREACDLAERASDEFVASLGVRADTAYLCAVRIERLPLTDDAREDGGSDGE